MIQSLLIVLLSGAPAAAAEPCGSGLSFCYKVAQDLIVHEHESGAAEGSGRPPASSLVAPKPGLWVSLEQKLAGPSSMGIGAVQSWVIENVGSFETRYLNYPVGSGLPWHWHPNGDHRFYVLQGKMQVECGGEKIELTQGDFIRIPRGQRHRTTNIGDTVGRVATIDPPQLIVNMDQGGGAPEPCQRVHFKERIRTKVDANLTDDVAQAWMTEKVAGLFGLMYIQIPVGNGLPLHRHPDGAHRFFVLQGRARVLVGNEEREVQAGDYAMIPQNTPHRTTNIGDVPLYLGSIDTPPLAAADIDWLEPFPAKK